MALELSIEGCTAVVHVQDARETTRKGQKDVLLRLKDSRGEILAEVKVPWPDGEPEPCEIKYVDSEECVKLTNNATFANVPLRISKIRELSSSRQAADLPKRFSGFSTTPILVSNSGQEALYNALKAFVREPVSDGKWSNVMKYLSAKGANADGFLTKDEQAVILRFIPTQSFNSRELRNICETLKKTNVFGPSCLASFYELCLSLDQTSIIQSVIDSSDALTEHSLAVFFNFVASNSSKDGEAEDLLLSRLLSRRFDARRMADAAARKISTQNVPTLLQKCMMMYVSPKYGDIAEQVLSLMTVLTDTFGNRLVWENDLHDVVKETLEFSERMSEVVSLCNQIDLKRKDAACNRELEDSLSQYRIDIVSLPRRTLRW